MAANWSLTTGEKYQKAEQRAGQDVRTFATYLQSIEDLLEPYMEAHWIQHFLSKLRPEVSRGIASLETQPKTLDDMIEAAAQIEENLKAEQKERNAAATPKKGAQTEKLVTPAPVSSSQGNWGGRGGRGGSTHGGLTLHGTRSTASTTPATQPNNTPATAMSQDLSQVTCWSCGQKGHYQSSCPNPGVKVNTTTAPRIEEVNTSNEVPKCKCHQSKKEKGLQ